MKYLIAALYTALLMGCSSSSSETEKGLNNPQVTTDQAALVLLKRLNRFPPRYPMKEASNGTQGCATVEYVVSPDKQVIAIDVVNATTRNFAEEARKVVSKWDWDSLVGLTFESPIKFQTRFEFCLDDGAGRCSMNRLRAKNQCTGTDIIPSIGMRLN